MIQVISKIISSVLLALYQSFWFALIMAALLMYAYLTAKDSSIKSILVNWRNSFLHEVEFRRLFYFFFYVTLILFRTLLNRNMWANPLTDVIGNWWIYNEKGELTTECFENLILFIPFSILMWYNFRDKLRWNGLLQCLLQSVKIVFLFSLAIEFFQLFLRLGTFQLSDLFYNTLGGVIGGFIYWIYVCCYKRKW